MKSDGDDEDEDDLIDGDESNDWSSVCFQMMMMMMMMKMKMK